MSGSLTTPLGRSHSTPPLERLLLDNDVNVELRTHLIAVGFEVALANETGANTRNDTDLLRWARDNNYILVCHDQHGDRNTRLELYPEIYESGGEILRIGGPPDQHPFVALGKILVHYEKWTDWFRNNDGIVTVHTSKVIPEDSGRLFDKVQEMQRKDASQAIVERTELNKTRRRTRRKPRPDQPPLL